MDSSIGLQNHPYLYSQYPIDFPSATSHTYSVGGISPQFGSPELYSPTALGSHSHVQELIQQNDASAQSSQQAPTVVLNSTRAAERWDGKSKLLRYLEPVVDKIRSFVDPIASVFYDAMPATFRGLNSAVSTAKSVESEVEEKAKSPREFLIPQPRHIAQRKISQRKPVRYRPKKYVEFKVDLDKLKHNKDFVEYVKTKKYKHNYPNTYYYPRIKYYVNPSMFIPKPNNNRLSLYRKNILNTKNMLVDKNDTTFTPTSTVLTLEPSDWKPIIVYNVTDKPNLKLNETKKIRRKKVNKKRKRTRRSLGLPEPKGYNYLYNLNIKKDNSVFINNFGRGFSDFITDIMTFLFKSLDDYTEKFMEDTLKPKTPPKYYSVAYNLLMYYLNTLEGLVEVHEVIQNHLNDDGDKGVKIKKKRKKSKNKIKSKKKPFNKFENLNHHDYYIDTDTNDTEHLET